MAIQDSRFDSLRAQGFTGTNDDMLLQWAQAAGATSNHVNDAVLEALLLNGATTACLSDAWVEYLISIGGNGTRNDMENAFWESGGIIDPVPPIPPDPVQDHLDRVSDTSDATWVADITTLIDTLVAVGVWDKLTDLSVPHNNIADSLLGIKGTQDSTAINAPVFNRLFGFRVGNDGADRYIDTNIRRVVNPLVIDNDAMSGFVYRVAASVATAGGTGSMGSRDNGGDAFIIGIIDATNSFASMGNTGNTVTSPFGGNGFIGASRTGAATSDIIRDTNISSSITASTGGAPDVNTIVVGGIRTDGVFSTAAGTEDIMAWGIGGALTSQNLLDLNNAIQIYVSARIAEAPPLPPTEIELHWARVADKSDPTLLTHLTTLFDELILKGIWDQLTDLCVMHTGSADSLLGLKGVVDSTNVNECAFDQIQGYFAGDDSQNRYINTGIAKNVPVGTLMNDDDMSAFMYRADRSDSATDSLGVMGARDGAANALELAIVDNTNNNFTAGTNGVSATQTTAERNKFIGVSRLDASNIVTVRDGVAQSVAVASTGGAPTTSLIVGGTLIDGSFTTANGTTMANAWGAGASLTSSQMVDLSNAIDTYMVSRLAVIPQTEYLRHVISLGNRRGNAEFESNMARLFEQLQGFGLYALMDEIWVNQKSSNDMLIGIKGLKVGVGVGSLQWAEGGGFLCGKAGGNRYVRTGIFNDGSNLFTTNSMSGFFVRRFNQSGQGGIKGTFAVEDSSRHFYMGTTNSGVVETRVGRSSNTATLSGGDLGFCGVTQTASADGAMVVNNVLSTNTISSTSGAPNLEIYACGLNSGGSYIHQDKDERLSAFGAGGGLADQQLLDLNTIIMEYLTNIGSA